MKAIKKMVVAGVLGAFAMVASNASAVVLGPNLIANGGDFESGTTSGWNADAAITLSVSNDTPDASSYSLKGTMTPQGGVNYGMSHLVDSHTFGGNYYLDFDFKLIGGGSFYANVVPNSGSAFADFVSGSAGAWHHYSYGPIAAPLGATSWAYVGIYPLNTGEFYIDNYSLRQEVVPEPASMALFGLPALAMCLRRRRK
ncbi:MAG: PEP-CTERM sorting domain-containing protein [Phycisphaerales bacterium]|nr:PEP-CTERM sorting domain-containing protein [Phycisphaerales bacterium]